MGGGRNWCCMALTDFNCRVTIPFHLKESSSRQHLQVERFKQVDSLIVINNKLRREYGNWKFKAGFKSR
jgi:hypothetical protein